MTILRSPRHDECGFVGNRAAPRRTRSRCAGIPVTGTGGCGRDGCGGGKRWRASTDHRSHARIAGAGTGMPHRPVTGSMSAAAGRVPGPTARWTPAPAEGLLPVGAIRRSGSRAKASTELMAAGLGLARIAELSGVARSVLATWYTAGP